jgi:LysR family transcriptional regulator, glycine cleavage system transcriptional activator
VTNNSSAARVKLSCRAAALESFQCIERREAAQHESTVSTSPDFAAKWLVHRLGRFGEKHPGIDLRVSATLHHVDFAREDIDMAVRHGVGEAIWQGLAGERLATETLFAVCSPSLLRKRTKLSPADVLHLPLLHLDDHSGWKRWFDAAQVKAPKSLQGVVLNRASMVIDAAINGQGIGLARPTLAAWDLINKRLIAPFPMSLPLTTAYWIVAPQATAELPKIATFRSWLLAEAAEDRRLLGALATKGPMRRTTKGST